ncbi:putative nucleotide-binding alpha-beta plait domain-containing protein [Tanacetum coccineum]
MEPSTEEVYAAFEKKVKKTIYIDNLSPLVTKAVLETAFNQFGTVNNVQFIPTHFASSSVYAALVEMQSVKQANEIVREMGDSPFMISGMPRPVRAQKAEVEMFDDRPKKRQRNIVCRWMDPSDPNFEVAKKMKSLTKKHAAEASFLMEQQLAEEEKLHNQQSETLKANYKKFELIDSTHGDGTAKRLTTYYETKLHDF